MYTIFGGKTIVRLKSLSLLQLSPRGGFRGDELLGARP